MNAFFLSLAYLFFLFFVATWASKREEQYKGRAQWVYVFSIAIYCTAWSFFGNIGLASGSGVLHLALYIGATLGLFLLAPVIKRLVFIKEKYHSTGLADVLAARFNRSQLLSALVSIICLLGIVPYLTIQLIAIIHSSVQLDEMLGWREGVDVTEQGLYLVTLLALFTIVFGVRKLDPTERHFGVIFSVAVSSIFKLIVWFVGGAIVLTICWDDVGTIATEVSSQRLDTTSDFYYFFYPPALSEWITMTILGFFGILLLPRQFHVLVVECANKRHVDNVSWQLPIYFLLFNVFVLPLTLLGIFYLPDIQEKDLLLLALPAFLDLPLLSIVIFLGGFAAAVCMLVVSTMALSTMLTNHILIPLLNKAEHLRFLCRYLLLIRWISVGLVYSLAYGYYLLTESNYLLIEIGSISFIAVLQFAPALLLGLFWRRATLTGVLTGMLVGSFVWFYTALMPTFIKGGLFDPSILSNGPMDIGWLRPEALLGLSMPQMPHSLFWSLSFNLTITVLLSLIFEEKNAKFIAIRDEFLNTHLYEGMKNKPVVEGLDEDLVNVETKMSKALRLFSQYLAPDKAKELVLACGYEAKFEPRKSAGLSSLSLFTIRLEHKLAGLIGLASAYKAVRSAEIISTQENQQILNQYAQLLARSKVSPADLYEKVSFYQEQQNLLEDHAARQQETIDRLQIEIASKLKAEESLRDLNEQLELRVSERTNQLEKSNKELTEAVMKLNKTRSKLVEAEKMASLSGLVVGLAHELNTPTGIMVTALSTLEEQLKHATENMHNNTLRKSELEHFFASTMNAKFLLNNNLQRLIKLIENFKLLNPTSLGGTPEVFCVKPAIELSIHNCVSDFPNSPVQCNVSCEETLKLTSYSAAFIQVCDLFIRNAIEHCASPQPRVDIICQQFTDELAIQIKDNGSGMTEKQKSSLFEPFYTTRRGEGFTGLGAHIAYNLVTHKLNGRIDVASDTNVGTTIVVYLPM